jgi:hypothetical protein
MFTDLYNVHLIRTVSVYGVQIRLLAGSPVPHQYPPFLLANKKNDESAVQVSAAQS